MTVDQATLTFSPSNWDTAQTVTVSAAQDVDAVNDAASITHAVDATWDTPTSTTPWPWTG